MGQKWNTCHHFRSANKFLTEQKTDPRGSERGEQDSDAHEDEEQREALDGVPWGKIHDLLQWSAFALEQPLEKTVPIHLLLFLLH